MNIRQIVLKILVNCEKNGVSLKTEIDRTFKVHTIDHRDKRLAFEIVYGVIRNKLMLDYVIEYYFTDSKFKENTHLMWILRIGMYQIVFLDKVPDHAAVNESVLLAKKDDALVKFKGVVNAVLRKIALTKNHLPKPNITEDLSLRLSLQYSHPTWMIKRWLSAYGLGNTKKILQFNNTLPSNYLRRKLKGLSRQQFESDIKSICNFSSTGTGYKNLYYALKKSVIPEDIFMLKKGYCTVQSISSGWVVALLDIKENDKILDMCAAPGGKAGFIAELAGKNGAVCASDIAINRLKKLNELKRRMHLDTLFLIACDGQSLPFEGKFDKVLLDVPCSGTGVIHRHPDIKWFKTPQDIENIVGLQQKLLDEAAFYVVPQGILVYSTCSLELEENHQQIDTFLTHHPEFVVDNPRGLVKDVYLDSNGYIFITPHTHSMDTMFAVRLKKITSERE